MTDKGTPPFSSHFDGNQVPTIMGVVGTMGTSDTAGTSQTIPFSVDPSTGAAYVNILQGSINIGTVAEDLTVTAGTITRVSTIGTLEIGTMTNTGTNVNIVTGTINSLPQVSVGTLESGTVKINDTPIQTPLDFGTLGTAGGSFFATISAASGAGTKHYISGLQIVAQSGTPDVRILMGSAIQGTGFLAGGAFVPNSGIVREFDPPRVTGTNSEIIYHFVSAGTVLISVNYWKEL